MAIQSQYFPKSERMPDHLKDLIDIFSEKDELISSPSNTLESNEVLAVLAPEMEKRGYLVEKGKSAKFKIKIPVLYGRNNTIAKAFEVDGFHKDTGTVVEIEAGRAVANYQFLKDLFEAIVMQEINYLVIAVRNIYKQSKDFEKVEEFIDVLYTSNRIHLPLKGILIIGY